MTKAGPLGMLRQCASQSACQALSRQSAGLHFSGSLVSSSRRRSNFAGVSARPPPLRFLESVARQEIATAPERYRQYMASTNGTPSQDAKFEEMFGSDYGLEGGAHTDWTFAFDPASEPALFRTALSASCVLSSPPCALRAASWCSSVFPTRWEDTCHSLNPFCPLIGVLPVPPVGIDLPRTCSSAAVSAPPTRRTISAEGSAKPIATTMVGTIVACLFQNNNNNYR
eukprot:COSAG05_NODE_939_length_6517_cov_2.480524_3_plen_227_part_00